MYMPTNPMEALTLARAAEKARTMFTQDGYSASLLFGPEVPNVWLVVSPEGANYTVDASKEEPTCNCPANQKNNGHFCKHSLGIEFSLIAAENAAYDAYAEAELDAYA